MVYNSAYKLKQNTLTNKLTKRILIVDDEQLILEGLSKALHKFRDFHGEIKTVENGKNAIEEISRCFYDICFLDIKLPDLSGLDVMKNINEISPETSVVIMTSLVINDDMKKTIEEGASLFIPKPFDLSQIKAFVKQKFDGDGDFYRDQKSYGNGFIKWKRKFKRRPLMKTINYSMSVFDLGKPKMLNLKADTIDISNAGIGIRTDYRLEPGHVLRFKKGVGHEAGIVKWSMMNDNNWRVGIKFI